MITSIGIDLVEIGRLRETLGRQGERFTRRVFTAAEDEYCRTHRDPVPHYAARFAAKEALFKALGTGWAQGVSWQEAEVRREQGKTPVLLLHGRAAEIAGAMGAGKVHLSLSHTDATAVAVVILERQQ